MVVSLARPEGTTGRVKGKSQEVILELFELGWRGMFLKFEEKLGKLAPLFTEGWNYLETLEKPSNESTTAFVAMWFSIETDTLWKKAIRPAVYDAGYEPVRIDAVEHSNKIDDEIIAKNSGLQVSCGGLYGPPRRGLL